MNDIELFLKNIRDRENESLQDMAMKLNIRSEELSNIEQGHSEMTAQILIQLLDVYDLEQINGRIHYPCACKECITPVPIGSLFCVAHDFNDDVKEVLL